MYSVIHSGIADVLWKSATSDSIQLARCSRFYCSYIMFVVDFCYTRLYSSAREEAEPKALAKSETARAHSTPIFLAKRTSSCHFLHCVARGSGWRDIRACSHTSASSIVCSVSRQRQELFICSSECMLKTAPVLVHRIHSVPTLRFRDSTDEMMEQCRRPDLCHLWPSNSVSFVQFAVAHRQPAENFRARVVYSSSQVQ